MPFAFIGKWESVGYDTGNHLIRLFGQCLFHESDDHEAQEAVEVFVSPADFDLMTAKIVDAVVTAGASFGFVISPTRVSIPFHAQDPRALKNVSKNNPSTANASNK